MINLETVNKIKQERLKTVTNIEKDAWKVSDNLAKAIEFLHKTDLQETTRRKMIRDMLKDNFVEFYKRNSSTKAVEEPS